MFSDSYGDIKFDIRRQRWYSIYMMNSDIETSKDMTVTVSFLLTELNAARARETRLAETLQALIDYARSLTIFPAPDGLAYMLEGDDEPEIADAVAVLKEWEER